MDMTLLTVLRERQQRHETLRRKAEAEVQRLEALLRKRFEYEKLFVVGSLASGRFTRNSDIDIVIKGLKTEDFFKAYALLIRESSYDIDLKPYEDLSEDFKADVLKGGIRGG